MPVLNGMETFARLRIIRDDVPVLFMSGYCTAQIDLGFAETTACGFITKPFRQHDLFTHLQRLLKQT